MLTLKSTRMNMIPAPRFATSTGRWVALAFAAWGLLQGAMATETEHTEFKILPAPGKVVIDGKFDDWDLSGSMFICSDVEDYRDQFASWQSAMYDADNLYLLTRWTDTTPMNNPGYCGSDMGFQGDCLQVRFIIAPSGVVPNPRGDNKTLNQRTTHVTAWSGKDGRNLIDLAYDLGANEGGIKDACKKGAQQAFTKNPDGKGYVQEIAIPWKLLTADGHSPKAGDTLIMTYEPNFSTASKMRVSTKDLFRPNVTPDRVFAFSAYSLWGLANLEAAGKVTPMSVRLSDTRTFPVKMENGIPVVDWKGLYKIDKQEGFAKIDVDMPEDGFVSMIIKNADGQVVRNLVNAQFMTKGKQEILWDGLATPSDRKPGDPVPVGDYTWEAIWNKGISLTLEGWACNAGKAPFDSPGGNWGGDMGDPVAVDSDGQTMVLGWAASEAGKAVVCTDLDGNVKWRHKRGGFGGAPLLTTDAGIVYVYDAGQGQMLYRLDIKTSDYSNWAGAEEATLELGKILMQFNPAGVTNQPAASGLAAIAGKIFVSYGSINNGSTKSGDTLVMLDGTNGKLLKSLKITDPGDLKVGADGKLYLTSAHSRISVVDPATGNLTTVIDGLKNARSVTADKEGNIYVGLSDPENQVAVYDKSGKKLRAIGKQGGRNLLGPWDNTGMRSIAGLKIDGQGKLWGMENVGMPRRISVWEAATGKFVKELFGPTSYGASGGAICPTDPFTVIGQGCEWKINPESGHAECVAVISRGTWGNVRFGSGKDGRVYAAVGGGWPAHVPVEIFERLSPGIWKLRTVLSQNNKPEMAENAKSVTVWSDKNDDQKQQPDEIKTYDLEVGGWIDGWYLYMNQAMSFGGGYYRIDVTGWTACGAPEYDLTKATKLPVPADSQGMARGGMGAQHEMISADNRYTIYNGFYGTEHSDFVCLDIASGKKVFAYPNNYVGVHGGHNAPPAKRGLIRGAYDIVGTVKLPAPLDNLFVIGTDKGEWHLLSSSGYYVACLFQGDPMKIKWPDEAVPGANMNTVPPGMGAEDFGGSVILANDGTMYVQHGKTAFIISKVNGLNTVKSLGHGKVKIDIGDTVKANQFKAGYLAVGDSGKNVTVSKKTVAFTGNPAADFGAQAVSFGQENAQVQSWLAHDDQNMYVGWQVEDSTPWINGATGYENLYACGDTVDFQLGVDPGADKKRPDGVKGDLRLSIGKLQGKNVAVMYRKVSDEKAPKTFYSGTCKGGYTMEFAKIIDDIKIEAKAVGPKAYVVEAAIPLKDLGVSLKPGLKLRGDLGVTFSDPDGKDTNLRVYWSNQAGGIVADEVEELKMQPALWGEFDLE